MPLDANLDCAYFMRNRERLLKLIEFLKENLDVTDENVALRATQERITRKGLLLRDSYSVSAMACLPAFLASLGGVEHFRTAPLEIIAGHRALAVYIINYLNDESEDTGKCPYFKCSLVTAEKLYKRIFQLKEDDGISKEEIRAMQHVLQSKNYHDDYFDLKQMPADSTWKNEDFLTRVKQFIQQQTVFDAQRKEKLIKKSSTKNEDNEEESEGQEGEDQDTALRQAENAIAQTTALAQEEERATAQISPLRKIERPSKNLDSRAVDDRKAVGSLQPNLIAEKSNTQRMHATLEKLGFEKLGLDSELLLSLPADKIFDIISEVPEVVNRVIQRQVGKVQDVSAATEEPIKELQTTSEVLQSEKAKLEVQVTRIESQNASLTSQQARDHAPADQSRQTGQSPKADHAQGAQDQEGKNDAALRQPEDAVDKVPATVREEGAPCDQARHQARQAVRCSATDYARGKDRGTQSAGQVQEGENNAELRPQEDEIDKMPAPVQEEERLMQSDVACRVDRSPSGNHARTVQEKGGLPVQTQHRGQEALNDQEDVSCCMLRRSIRKSRAPVRLNL